MGVHATRHSRRATGDVPSSAFAEERRAHILRLLNERGRVHNRELSDILGVAEPTVRKDVADLASQGLLTRTHGGAVRTRPVLEPDLTTRVDRNSEAKTRVARACLSMVGAGDAVYLDAGSSVLRIAQLLVAANARPDNINVLTNALAVAHTLAGQTGLRHTVLGGTYRPVSDCFVGPLALSVLADFTVNLAFIGVSGFSEQGFTVADLGEAQLKAAVIERARRVVVVMDRSKEGIADFARICGPESISTVVTDDPSDYLTARCEEEGVELLVASA